MTIKRNCFILLFIFTSFASTAILAQSTGGNLTIGENGVIYVHGEHSFISGGGFINPGMIETSRSGDKGYLIFSEGSSWKGAGVARFVNGYVKVLHNQPFVFPVGMESTYRPVAISGAIGTAVAYYKDNPAKAGSKLINVNQQISQKEYWDVKGEEPITFTLTWAVDSEIKQLTDGKLENLTILGLKDGQWHPITSELAEEAVAQLLLDKESTFSSGAISTTNVVIPNDYELFTLGTSTAIHEEIAIVKVFPNPTVRDLYVDIKKAGIQKGSILIYDVNGRQMIERKFDDSSKTTQRFDVSNYSDGLFKVQVKSADIQITEPFIISNQ